MNDHAYIPERWLKNVDRNNVVEVKKIFEVVQNYFGISRSDLMQRSKKRKIVYPRQVCIWLLAKYSIHGAQGISVLFDFTAHQSATAAVRAIDDYLCTDEKVKEQIDFITKLLKS